MYDTQNLADMCCGKVSSRVHIGQWNYANRFNAGSNAPHIVTYRKPYGPLANFNEWGKYRHDAENGSKQLCAFWYGRDDNRQLITFQESCLIGRLVAFKTMPLSHSPPDMAEVECQRVAAKGKSKRAKMGKPLANVNWGNA